MASPQTVIRGNTSSVAQYELPPGVFQYIQAVHVVIDNTAGPDVRPTLSVLTQDGVVMASKRQGETLPAADTGSATWALRLTDETAGAVSTEPNIVYTLLMGSAVGDTLVVQVASSSNPTILANTAQFVTLTGIWTVGANDPLQVNAFNWDAGAHTGQMVQANVQQVGAAAREIVQGNPTALAAGPSSQGLTFDTVISGGALLDLTVPSVPKFVAAGTYAVSVTAATF